MQQHRAVRRSLPEPLSFGPFRYAEAVAAGVPRSRLRRRDIHRPHRGLYVPTGQAGDVVDRCESLVPLLGEHHWFSHLTAARLWGIPLPAPATTDEPLHVVALAGTAPMRREGVVGWEMETQATAREMCGLLPVLSPAAVWGQLAVPGAVGIAGDTGTRFALSHEWLVAAGDFLLTGPRLPGGRRPLCTREDLVAAVASRRRRRGVRALEGALPHIRANVHSPRETMLRLGLVACGLPEPDIQVPVHTADGLRHADLGYPHARILIEYLGDHHRTDRAQWREDLRRLQLFEDAGYRTISVTADDLEDGCVALAGRVRRARARATS